MGSEGLKKEEVELELGLSLGGSYGNVLKAERDIQGFQKQEKRKREEKEINGCNDSVRVKLGALAGNESEGKNHEEQSGKMGKKSKVNEQGVVHNKMGSMKQSIPVQYFYPYPYPNPQFQGVSGIVVPFVDGSLVPCWYGKEGNGVVNSLMSYGFVPAGNALVSGLGKGLEQNGSMKEEKKKPASAESSMHSSSGRSGRKSSSYEGGGSNDSRSHSICSLPKQCNVSNSSNSKSVSEHTATSDLSNSALVNEATNHTDMLVSSNSSQSCLSGPKEAVLQTESDNTSKEISTPADQILGSSIKTKREVSKPPKPHIQKQNPPPSFSYMPCVWAKGDGPDGKTINGFLHRYTKTEVSIICSCHGSIFSPAGFVQHAGGKDVSHPLRHITVMPPAF